MTSDDTRRSMQQKRSKMANNLASKNYIQFLLSQKWMIAFWVLGWSYLALLATFEMGHIATDQVYFLVQFGKIVESKVKRLIVQYSIFQAVTRAKCLFFFTTIIDYFNQFSDLVLVTTNTWWTSWLFCRHLSSKLSPRCQWLRKNFVRGVNDYTDR